ncbi:hypothetical protein [Streptomyces sp. NPDC059639]
MFSEYSVSSAMMEEEYSMGSLFEDLEVREAVDRDKVEELEAELA